MTRSATLLKSLLDEGTLPPARIARALECVETDLPALAHGDPMMPLGMQLRLALLVIAEVPLLARSGHALKAQVEAATSFHARRPVSADRPGWPKGSGGKW
jgi:hypothetical protein